MAISGAVYARIVSQYSDKGSKAAQKDIKKTAAKIDAFNKRIVKSYAVAAAAAAAFVIKIGKDAITAAIEDSKSATILANTLRNVAGATDSAIAAVEEYITKQQSLTNIQDTDLRASLNALVAATGDVAQAQYLQSIAVDAAVGSNQSLEAVSRALAKAMKGNLAPLGKLFPALDKNIIKTGNFAAAMKALQGTYKGAAKAVADQDPFTRLKISFDEILESLGYALLPTLQQFATYIITDVIPNIEEWVKLNEDKLVNSFKSIIEILDSFAKNFLAILLFIEKYRVLIGIIGAIPFISVVTNQILLLGAIARKGGKFLEGLYKVFKTKLLPVLARVGRVANAVGSVFTTGGMGLGLRALFSALKKAIKPLGIVVALLTALGAAYSFLKKQFGDDTTDKVTKSLSAQAEAGRTALRVNRMSREELKKKAEAEAKAAAAAAKAAAAAAKAAKEEQDRAKFEADYAKLNEKLAKRAGVKLLTSEEEKMVQINAAIALAERAKEAAVADKKRLESMKEEIIALRVRNDLALRYQDILKALADTKIDDKELIVLAKIWGVPVEAAKTYIETLFAIEDATITDDEIIKLAMSWGSTQEQAARYLDFYQYINDGVLSDAEIEKLKSKWKMTELQVRQYADFVGVVNDGKLTDAEIKKLQDRWKLSVDQVVDYIKYIGSPVSYSGTLIDPAKAAEIGWLNATAALQRYLDLLKKGTGVLYPSGTSSTSGTPFVPGSGNDPAVIAAAAEAATEAAAAAADAAAALAESIDALISSDPISAIREAATTEDINKAVAAAQAQGKSASDIANAMMVGLTGMGMDSANAASTARYTGQAIAAMQQQQKYYSDIAAFQAKERADALANTGGLTLAASDPYADAAEMARIRRMQNSGTISTAASISGGNLMAAPVVNITVQGSVTSEQDLITAVRDGLLATQYNGNTLTLQAI